jgi:hypothetical protein
MDIEKIASMTYLDYIKLKVPGWANQMYSRFGYPVYLVGSSLFTENPRDIDIRINLPDNVFIARYGPINQWMSDTWKPVWGIARQNWAKDMSKLSLEACLALKMNIDFQVEPIIAVYSWHKNKPKLRIDTIEDNKDTY